MNKPSFFALHRSRFQRPGWFASVLAVVCGLMALLAGLQTAIGQTPISNYIYEVDASAFPAVKFKLRSLDASGRPRANLTSQTVKVLENGSPIEAAQVSADTEPLTYVFVIDQPRSANYRQFGVKSLQDGLVQLTTGGYFRDGMDKVVVMTRRNRLNDLTELPLPLRQRGDEFATAIRAMDFAAGNGVTRGLEAMNDALDTAGKETAPVGAKPAAIIFITSGIEEPQAQVALIAAQTYAARAAELRVPIFVLHTNPAHASRGALEALALSSGGKYVVLNAASAISQIDAVYREINTLRTSYKVSYVSALADNGTRRITVNSAQETALAGEYQVQVNAPQVKLDVAEGNQIDRIPAPGASISNAVYLPAKITVIANVDWADKVPRQIQSAKLFVNGVQKAIQTGIASGVKQVRFETELSGEGSIASPAATLRVEVRDSVGMSGAGERTLQMRFLPLPTPTPPQPSISLAVLMGGGLAALALLGAGILGVVFLRRRSSGGAAKQPASQNSTGRKAAKKSGAYARLLVLDGGPDMIGREFPLEKSPCVAGRAGADLPLTKAERSSISRAHCVFEFDPRDGLSVSDRGSTNGTWVNGKRLAAQESATLQDGYEVVVGNMREDGVKLRVMLLDNTHIIR